MQSLLEIVYFVLETYKWIIIIAAILSWLIAFNVVNVRNQLVRTVYDVTTRLTEPLLRPIRRVIPPISGLDISPMILFILIVAVQIFIRNNI